MAKTRPLSPSSREEYLALAERAQELLNQRNDPRAWIEANLWLRSKDQRMVPFHLWPAQAHWYEHRSRHDVILKARQLGFTSIIEACFFADTVLRPNTTSVIVAYELDSAEKIFAAVRGFWERLPEEEQRRIGQPRYVTRREMYWPELNSRFWVGTAGSTASGRGHTIHNLHCSEFAYWPRPEKVLAGLTEAVPVGGRICIESTASGLGGYFHDLWLQAKQGENLYRPHFYPWFWDASYRMSGPPLGELTEEELRLRRAHGLGDDQLRWRRVKMRELRDRFAQEYPEDDVSCFLASGRGRFNAAVLAQLQSRIATEPEPESVAIIHLPDGRSLPLGPAELVIWREPEPGRRYVIGADIGEGLAHGDPSSAVVLEEATGEQVAELHGRLPPAQFARLLGALGYYYLEALLGVERNNHGHSALNTLMNEVQYSNLYRHIDYHDPRNYGQLPGWPTNAKTKPVMIDDLDEAIAEGHLRVHSAELVRECLTYVVDDAGATGAQPGHHDDRVIAAAIA